MIIKVEIPVGLAKGGYKLNQLEGHTSELMKSVKLQYNFVNK